MKFAVYTLYLFISLGLADLQAEKFGAIGNFQSSERTLILYLSRTNNTKTVAGKTGTLVQSASNPR